MLVTALEANAEVPQMDVVMVDVVTAWCMK